MAPAATAATGAGTLGRCAVATAERAVGPRKGAINDGEAEAATEPGLASNEGVAEATSDCGWNSCRFIATRCR